MIRLFGYFKPYLPALLLAIALLFVQANADLALPDYMSRIVNNGIQQGGVETVVPQVVSQQTFDELLLFVDPSESEILRESYTLAGADSIELNTLRETNPELTSAPVYVLTSDDPDQIEILTAVMARAFLTIGGIRQGGAASGESPIALPPGRDLSEIPQGADPLTVVAGLPDDARIGLSRMIADQFSAMGPTMLTEAAATAVRAEYESIGMNTLRIQSSYILRTGFVMILLTLLSAVSTIGVGYISAKIAAGFSRDIRLAVFERVERFSSSEIDKFSTASLITRSTNDVMQIQLVVVMLVRMVFYAPIIGVGGVIRAIGKSSSMWWVIAAAVGILMVLVLVVYKVAVPKFKLMQKLVDKLNLVSRESLSGLMVIRAFAREKHEEERFDRANHELTDTTLYVNRVMVVMMPVMMLIMNALSVLVIWVGAQQIAMSAMQVGDMIAFLQYTMQIVFAFLMLSMMFVMLPRASVSAGRIADVLETEPTITDPPASVGFRTDFDGTVEFRNVSFRYPNAEEDVLHDISFTARTGETTAVIGATGSGKSTIINLIPRFYDVTRGAILIGGTDIREVSQHELRQKLGYVPQKATLFSGTIESNLRYADDDADAETVTSAVAIAQAEEFVNERPEGMEAEISQGGANISGGQKQRLSIARAIVGDRPIYLFDDSFSALDFRTDSSLRRALAAAAGESTRVIVTQRVATVKTADQIIVLDGGRVAGKGNHAELMETCDTYREIALSQLTEEELS